MADGYLNFDTQIDTKGFNSGAKKLKSNLGGLKSALFKVGAAAAAAFSAKAIVDFAKQTKEAWETQLIAEQKLETVMRQRMNATDESIKGIKEYASALQETGVIGDEVQLSGAQQIATFLTEADSLKTLMPAMNNLLAQQKGLNATTGDAVSIGNLMGKVMQGQTSALTRVGITFSQAEEQVLKYGTESERAAMLAQVITNNVGDMNAALANTDAGRQAQLANTMGDVKEQFGAAVIQIQTIFLPLLKTFSSALAATAGYARTLSQALANIFGNNSGSVASSSVAMADSSSETADNYADIADSAEAAQAAQEKTLASFDKINKISENSGSETTGVTAGTGLGGTVPVAVDADVSSAEKKIKSLLKWVKSSFKTLFEPLKSAWDKNGGSLIDSIHVSFDSILGLLGEIGGSFATVWTNGTGEQIVGNYLQIWTNISDTIGNIADRLKTAWTTDNLGTDIVQHAADIWNTILEHVNNITGQISDWSATVDFTPMLAAFDSIETALQPFADNVGEGLEWFFENVLLPLAGWTIEDVIPAFLDLLSDAIDGINSVWDAAEPVVMRLWDDFLSPIASWAADTAVNAINGIGDGIKKICGNVTSKDVENLAKLTAGIGAIIAVAKGKQAIDNISKSFAGLKGSIKTGLSGLNQPVTASLGTVALAIQAAIAGWTIGTWIYDTYGDEIDTVLYPIYDAFVACWNAIATFFTETVPQFFSDLWESIKNVFSAVGEWFTDLFITAWNGIKTAWSGVKKWFSDLWTNIKNIFSAVGNWFKEIFSKAWNGIKGAWNGVKQWFSDLWGNIKGVFASVGSWFSTKFTTAWENIKSAFSSTAKFFSGLWTAIKKPFVSIAKWFKDKFTDAWEAVKGVFSKGGKIFDGIKEGISGVFTSVVNKLIDGINVIIAKPLEFLNGVLNDIKDIEVAGVTPFSGFWDYDPIPVPQIPKLATGAYVPANYGEFLAVLGDNKREAEIVAPESKLQEAVEKVMKKYVGSGGDIVIHYTVDIDGKILHKEIVRVNKNETKRTGTNPMTDF